MFDTLKTKVLKRKLRAVKEGIIELEANITYHKGLLEYERDTLSKDQISQYEIAIKQSEAQIKTNKDFIRYIEPLL